ncbi:unnamed protein product [Chrysodeixis includens]|uniref:Uncharacterized protein n=1 Tax=Chrysodeixis includens TaxID=689277 RepID=A0A9P0BPA6_CHRIL|nr:unnamed protein product [Chrysodeixis includens]
MVDPVSQKKVETLLAQSEENKKALGLMVNHGWCRNFGTNKANLEENPSSDVLSKSSMQSTPKHEDSVRFSSEANHPEETKTDLKTTQLCPFSMFEKRRIQHLMDAPKRMETSAASIQTCCASSPGPSTSAQPDLASAIVSRGPSPAYTTKGNFPYSAHDTMPQTVQRGTSAKGRRRSQAARGPRARAQRQGQTSYTNTSHQQHSASAAQVQVPHTAQQTNQNTQLVPFNPALQAYNSHTSHQLSHCTHTHCVPLMPRNSHQMSPQAAHIPPHHSQLAVPHQLQHAQRVQYGQYSQHSRYSHDLTRAAHHSSHIQHELRGNVQQNAHVHGPNCLNYLDGSMGHNNQNVMYCQNMGHHSSYVGESNQNYTCSQQWERHQNVSGEYWHEPIMTGHQTITCSSLSNYTTTHSLTGRCSDTSSMASHTIANESMALSVMSNSTMADTTNSAGRQHRLSTLALAASSQWSPQDMANASAEHRWEPILNVTTQYRAQNRLAQRRLNGVTHNFFNTAIEQTSPRLATAMPEYLWTCRNWPTE